MTETNVRPYTDDQIFDRVMKLFPDFNERRCFQELPLLIGVQSNEDSFNDFDDKFYLYDRFNEFIMVTSGTTNAGATGLKNFIKWNPKGTGVWKTDEFYPRCFKYGHMRGMECLRLSTQIKHYRDNNKDEKVDETGPVYLGNTGAHFHGVSYEKLEGNKKIQRKINGWSVMCQVANVMEDYAKIIEYVRPQRYCDYILLKEWEV